MRTPDAPLRLLLRGRPATGKTTVARRLVDLLVEAGVPVRGFTTAELRRGGAREGFVVIPAAGGPQALFAHVDLPGPPRVGRYGVDLAAFEQVALPTLEPLPGGVVVVDELGPMELASAPFRERVRALFDSDVPVVATIHARPHPLTDELQARAGVEVVAVTRATRDPLPTELAERLLH